MQIFETAIGVIAAMLTSLSYIPQVRKVRAGQSTADLSSRMLIALTSGLGLWVLYGAVKADWIIIAANVVGTSLTGYVLYHKLHERQGVDEARLTPPKACGGSIPVEVANSPVGTNIWRPGAVVSKRLATTRKVPASIFALTPG